MPRYTCKLTLNAACSSPPQPHALTITGETKLEVYEKIARAMQTFARSYTLFPDQVQTQQLWKEEE